MFKRYSVTVTIYNCNYQLLRQRASARRQRYGLPEEEANVPNLFIYIEVPICIYSLAIDYDMSLVYGTFFS